MLDGFHSAHFGEDVPGIVRSAEVTGLKNSKAQNTQRINGACTDTNTNESFVLGNIRVKEPLEFVYSTFNEPHLFR